MPKDNSKPQRERRRREAEQRQAEYDAKSPQQQLDGLAGRGRGPAAKEWKRIWSRLVIVEKLG